MDLNDAVVAAAWAKAQELGLDKALDISEVRQIVEAGFAAVVSAAAKPRARLADVIDAAYDDLAEAVQDTTLGDVLVGALMADTRWTEMSARFWDAADGYMQAEAPAAIAGLVRAEVARQLESAGQGAVTRGKPSTLAEAIVAVEVTTQLRARFGAAVDQALAEAAERVQVVCSACLSAECAAGNLLCGQARTAGLTVRSWPGRS